MDSVLEVVLDDFEAPQMQATVRMMDRLMLLSMVVMIS
jgi:hypothetical protein